MTGGRPLTLSSSAPPYHSSPPPSFPFLPPPGLASTPPPVLSSSITSAASPTLASLSFAQLKPGDLRTLLSMLLSCKQKSEVWRDRSHRLRDSPSFVKLVFVDEWLLVESPCVLQSHCLLPGTTHHFYSRNGLEELVNASHCSPTIMKGFQSWSNEQGKTDHIHQIHILHLEDTSKVQLSSPLIHFTQKGRFKRLIP